MIRYFCDACGGEINSQNEIPEGKRSRLVATVESADRKHSLTAEVMTSLDGCANSGHFCKYCVIDAILALDDRPRDAPGFPS